MHDIVTPPPRSRARPLRRILQVVAALLALLVLAYAILYITKGRFLREPFIRLASSNAQRAVTIGGDFQLYLNPNVKFVAEDIAVANPTWAKDVQLFSARRVDLELSLWRLIFGERRFRYLTIDRGTLGLERDKQGRVSWSFDSDTPLEIPAIERAAITGTRIHYRDDPRRIDLNVTVGDVAATADQGRGRVAGPLIFKGGGTAMGAPFTLTAKLTTPNATIVGGRTGLELRIGVADTRIDVTGTLPGATQLDGADLKFLAAGRNLQTPFALIGIAVPATRSYRLAGNLTKTGDEFRFTNIAGRFGDSDLAGRLTIGRRDGRLRLDGVLSSKVLDILDVGPWLGYSPARMDAPGGGVVTTEAGRPRVLPDARLAIDGLGAFDANVKYTAARVRTGNALISKVSAEVTLDDRKLSLAPLALDLAGGRLTSTIVIDARRRPVVTDYDIRLTKVPLGRLLTSLDVENSGATASVRGRIQLKGRGDSVRASLGSADGRIALVFPSGTLWVRHIQLAKLDLQNFLTAFLGRKLKRPSDIRCGLIAFTVKDGVGTADPIFFDTKRAIFRGEGRIDFNDETLRLSVEGDSKEFSLFSGQSPIGIGGYFAAPTINPISGKLIGRAAVGVALGVVAPPLAILAFVDLGEESDTNCTAVLAGARGASVKAADIAAEKRR